jgi:hypothetical protein
VARAWKRQRRREVVASWVVEEQPQPQQPKEVQAQGEVTTSVRSSCHAKRRYRCWSSMQSRKGGGHEGGHSRTLACVYRVAKEC